MTITIQSPGVATSPQLEKFVRDEVSKFSQLYEEVISTEVCLSLDSSSKRENKNCRIRLVIPGNDLLATATSRSFEEAVMETAEALEKQIVKRKAKRREDTW